jgi:hypothetical protein
MQNLKPCPFCGEVSMTFNGFDNQWYVYHKGEQCAIFEPIGIDGYFCKTEEEAVDAWNRRANDEQADC